MAWESASGAGRGEVELMRASDRRRRRRLKRAGAGRTRRAGSTASDTQAVDDRQAQLELARLTGEEGRCGYGRGAAQQVQRGLVEDGVARALRDALVDEAAV